MMDTFIVVAAIIFCLSILSTMARIMYLDSMRRFRRLDKAAKAECIGCKTGAVILLEGDSTQAAVYRPRYNERWATREGLCNDCYERSRRIRDLEWLNLEGPGAE